MCKVHHLMKESEIQLESICSHALLNMSEVEIMSDYSQLVNGDHIIQ